MVCIVLQWLIYFLLLFPSYLWLENLYSLYELDFYCGIAYEHSAGLYYVVLIVFALPVICLTLIYVRMMRFVRHQNPEALQSTQGQRSQRDFIVIRRILFTVVTLTIPGVPNVIFTWVVAFDHRLSGAFHMYRIQWMGPLVTFCVLNIALVLITPPLKEVCRKLLQYRPDRVEPSRNEQRRSIALSVPNRH